MTSRAIFEGEDKNENYSLWVTDGTAAGTSELTVPGAGNAGFDKTGFGFNLDFTVLGSKVLFDGIDASGKAGLWVTDGTAAGTSELAAGGADANGLFAGLPFQDPGPEFTVLGRKALFEGADASGHHNLWMTDGTSAGTSELTVAGTPPNGLFDHSNYNILNPDFTVFGTKALFVGGDNLYVTNGTSAGTSELTAAGAYPGALFAYQNTDGPHFAVLGTKVLFHGTDAGSHGEGSLWVTDGTSAGTSELIAAGANANNGLDPRGDFAVIGSKAVFVGFGPDFSSDLWVTDGTSAGTSELTVAGTSSEDLGLSAVGLTVFGSKVLFSGKGALWVTDGTSAGTSELVVAGVSPFGLDPTEITVFGSKVLFEGEDASGNSNLWVTDGTSAGTKELTNVRTPSGGLFPSEITVLGNEALFAVERTSIWTDLWVTDGTAAGTRKLAVAGAFSSGLTPSDITALPPPPPPAPSGLALASGSDSGVKGDDITNVTKPTITGKGVVGDKVTLRDGAKVIGTAVAGKGGAWSVTPTSALAAGVHTLTATESGKTGTSAASAALTLTIKTSAAVPAGLGFAVGADKGAAGDMVTVTGTGEAGDRVTVFDGSKALRGATVGAGGAWTVTLNPLAIGAHSLNASEADVAGNTSLSSPAERLVVAHAAANSVSFFGSAGMDRFTGGAGNDVFRFSAADLDNTDIAKGGGGNDQLKLTSAGAVRAKGVGGVETYVLFNGAGNALTLTGANFAGVTGSAITVDGGNAADMLSGAGLSALDKAVLKGGAGADTLIAGRNAALTGGAGKDVFVLTVPGSPLNPDKNTITDFAHGTDKLALSEKGFGLGSSPDAATLFAANKTGSFTGPNQRFAYATGSGELFFDARGNAAPSSKDLIATLAGSPHPTLTLGDIAFVA